MSTYGSTTYRRKGINLQPVYIEKLNEKFSPKGIRCVTSTLDEDMRLGIDCWFLGENIKEAADLKTKKSEESQRYSMTSYTAGFHEYIFKKSQIKYYIFVAEGKFFFVHKNRVQKWYEDRHTHINDYENCGDYPGLSDDSKYFHFPLYEVKHAAHKIMPIE